MANENNGLVPHKFAGDRLHICCTAQYGIFLLDADLGS